MPYLSDVVTARDGAALKTNLDAWFAAHPADIIRYFQLLIKDQIRFTGVEFRAIILYETGVGAPAVPPFTATVLQAGSGAAFATNLAAAIAAAPAELFRGPFSADLAQSRRTEDLVGVVFQTADLVNGAVNWP